MERDLLLRLNDDSGDLSADLEDGCTAAGDNDLLGSGESPLGGERFCSDLLSADLLSAGVLERVRLSDLDLLPEIPNHDVYLASQR